MGFFRRITFNLWYYRDPRDFPTELMDFIQTNPPGRALELGCRTGNIVITLARHEWQIVGVDFARQSGRHIKK
jgi:ubiquinone/menaquinone biosynthesis C-methylase UbiE